MSEENGKQTELLYAETPEGVEFRENGLRNLEAKMQAKVYETPEVREKLFAEFYAHAAKLRAVHVQILLRCCKESDWRN